jgi:hypothetical protein
VKSAEESVTVVLIDDTVTKTVTKDDRGLWPGQEATIQRVLIPGLKVDVDGRSDGRVINS